MDEICLTATDGVRLRLALHVSSSVERGTVVQAHGITADMDEGGMFVRLAEQLAAEGFNVVRFDYRGHGRSGGASRGVTVAGEMIDLDAIVEDSVTRFGEPLAVVAASFGAVSTLLSLSRLPVRGLVLWNPVLDLTRTFVEPELPWGIENFADPRQRGLLRERGYLPVDGGFELGWVAFEEFHRYGAAPLESFLASSVPALVVHGDQDQAVSYDIARDAAEARPSCDFHTVAGSDHGFDSREREDEAIAVTVRWLGHQFGGAR
ncbi:alpha/beta hydrolase [Pseudofrankia sp. BMG5.37]|uniref:alpha/beta hydrolase n=1 Tax=Pseudofrankia sp. BMG5.37 TaxID=3050035 RepID=UPI0028961680|nr:alpha/beta hydrolase [Pseudofrankia sp. BMG5.37]MDT3444475.1 alpha/beta hydrolase [Pseudofrankia sp. BMG5.37]